MDKKLISCAFNIDTARVVVKYADGLTFDPIPVKNEDRNGSLRQLKSASPGHPGNSIFWMYPSW